MSAVDGSVEVSLRERFEAMVTMRAFEHACAEGVRTGELRGELHLAVGQEGVAAGMLGSLRPDDWVVGTHRSHPAALAKGIDPYRLLAEVYEKSTGLCRGKGGHLHLFSAEARFSTTGIVGSSLPVALGHAYAASLDGEDYVAIGLTGDGGTNTGQFFETLNMAAIWNLPLVVVVENNGFGISVPALEVIAEPGIAARARAFGIAYEDADGSDVEAVAAAMAAGIGHARAGRGPVLVEVACQRFSGHYEGDPDHYRSQAVKESMVLQDPIERARTRLVERDGVDPAELAARQSELEQRIGEVLTRVRADDAPLETEARTGVFVEVTG